MLFIPHRCYTLTEQSPHMAPNGAHFQGAQTDYSQTVVLRELQWWINVGIPMKLSTTYVVHVIYKTYIGA